MHESHFMRHVLCWTLGRWQCLADIPFLCQNGIFGLHVVVLHICIVLFNADFPRSANKYRKTFYD